MNKAFFNWSGGKDSALALYKILTNSNYQIHALLTNISRDHQRISMHGVPKSLLLKQVNQLELNVPLELLELWESMSMEDYGILVQTKMQAFKAKNIQTAIFGDIFLEDLRAYRVAKLAEVNMLANFPLWGSDTRVLVEEFIDLGFKAVVVAVNANLLNRDFVGATINADFLNALPQGVDPCGEHGEFHSFVYDGPIFKQAVGFELGNKVLRTYESKGNWNNDFWFQDLLDPNT